jgi:hypothetical protein
MSEFITLYRRRQDVRWKMRSIKSDKHAWELYQKLMKEEKELTEKLDAIIDHEKQIARRDKL